MIATIGFVFAIGLLVYMIIRGIDMITATVVTAAVILVTSGLNVWDGFLTTYSGGIGSFVTSWFLILGLGGVFGQLVLEAGLATRIAKTLTEKLGAKMVGAVILICSFFITLLGINGYIMVFVLYPIADNLLKQRDKIEAAGSKFVLLIVPNKESVYFEYLPDEIREKKAKSSRTDDLVGYLQANTDLDIIYVKDKYLSMKDETQIYYKTDTHWNMVGCYVALQEVLRNLYGTYTDVNEVTFQEHLHDFAGDLATMADVGVAYGIDTVYFLGEDQARDEQKVEDSLLLVGDSFAEFLLLESPYYFKGGVINGDIVPYDYNFVKATAANLSQKPDVVLWECCERHIDRLGWDE